MLVDSIGDVTITNDGATILGLLEVQHPAARILVDLARQQDVEVGDGTTSVVLLAAEMLRRGNEAIKTGGCHPTTVIAGFRIACREATALLQEHLRVPIDSLGRDCLLAAAATCAASKSIGADEGFWAPLLVEAIQAVRCVNARGQVRYPVAAVGLLKAPGQSPTDSQLIRGYALNCSLAAASMKRRCQPARIACCDLNFMRHRLPTGVSVALADPRQLEAIRQQESEITLRRLKAICAAGANVLVTSKGIDDACLGLLLDAGVMAVRRCTRDQLKRIAKATGATLVSSLANLDGGESFEPGLLGAADEVLQQRVGEHDLLVVRGGKAAAYPAATLLLRGPNEAACDEVERACHDVLSVLSRTLEGGACVAGGGACEAACSLHLERYAASVGSREQVAIAEWAAALLVVPRTLAVNAAKDCTELLASLRAHHAVTGSGAASFKHYGLDLQAGCVRDCLAAGVLEPAAGKIKAYRAATEAAIAILRIDDHLRMAAPAEQQPPHAG